MDVQGGGGGADGEERHGAYGPCSQEHGGAGEAQEVAAAGKAEIVVESDGFGHEDWGRQTVLRPDGKAELQKVVLVP